MSSQYGGFVDTHKGTMPSVVLLSQCHPPLYIRDLAHIALPLYA